MRYVIGLLLFLAGSLIGLFGDYPFDGLPHQYPGFVALGGVLAGIGLVMLILTSGGRGEGRGDEPPSYIRP
jgi:hypothetical protein